MLKKPLLICFLLSSLISFSQEIVKEFDLKLEKKRDFFQIVNESKKEVVLLLNDKEKVTSIRFDETFSIKDSLSFARPERMYEEIIGYSQNENDYFVFWGSKDRKKISSQYFNFTTKESKTNSISLELKKEKVIKELTIKNVFYLITIVKNTSILKLYISDNNGNLIEKTMDLSHLEFKNMYNNPADLYTVLTDESSEPSFQNITNDSPPSLALSAKRYKIYTYSSDEIIFTIDNTANATQILRVNLQNFTSDLKSIAQPKIEKGQYGSLQFKSNSFLIDDKILQLKTNSFVLFVTISDLNGTKIKEYKVLHDQEIDFKNSDFVQESNGIHNQKIIENTEKFLRKIHNFPSISCYKSNGVYYTILGSSVDKTHYSGGMGMGAPGIGMGTVGMVPVFYGTNYTVENLISYKDKIVFYTNCLFDSNFNHVKGEIKSSAFDKVRAFIEENNEIRESVTLLTTSLYKDLILFKHNTNLYLGNYNKKNKKYQIFSFSE
ncbi:hypothetical protein [Flavobacterium quisquiliarum]|uniref:6-bladed beta-propeller protein n=1 Tax=Flavobacterium quisquiliarum TaxID=1834436 RepID=A0ABV8W9X1_9FLAO|nr:hypothetical protein [Flavobacterium quisquiliarum]MBW1657893.1 hypothetical protein [Flavobacterium quisquiliarum]NWL00951.1 hypothetical protein [Flavobacterium collinsii]